MSVRAPRWIRSIAIGTLAVGCTGKGGAPQPNRDTATATPATAPAIATPAAGGAPASTGFTTRALAEFDEPWAMAFLPDGRALVTERSGALQLVALPADGAGGEATVVEVKGAPEVDHGGQGGLGDVVLHPRFADNGLVYLSWAEAGKGDTRGAAVGRARLVLDPAGPRLDGLRVIWRQTPKVEGRGHFGHRLAFAPDGSLFVSSGERQKFTPAQDLATNLGKILRLDEDGRPAPGNPFADRGGVAAEIWTTGHRNPLGLAFDAEGRLWEHEMGPKGGDELNRIERGTNYGYPLVSNGDHYDGEDIPDHDTAPQYNAPEVSWNPVISPAGFVIVRGDRFPGWRGSGLIGGLSSKALIRVVFTADGTGAREAERFDMGERIREVEEGPGGRLFVLEDGDGGRLLELVPG